MSRAFLPRADATLLLRACLTRGDVAREAWRRWCEAVGDPLAVLRAGAPALRRLLPLVQDAVQRQGLAASGRLATTLRTAAFREELRYRALRPAGHRALEALSAAGVPFLVLRGVALAETLYARPWLRHCHDLDLLLRSGKDRRRAVEALRAAAFSAQKGTAGAAASGPKSSSAVLVHESGLPVSLHSRLFEDGRGARQVEQMWERSGRRQVCDSDARCLAPRDQLLHVCAHAWFQGREASLVWVCDAHGLVNRLREDDWGALSRAAVGAALVEPLTLALDYLAGTLFAPVPEAVFYELAAARLHAVEHGEPAGDELAARARAG